MKILVGMQKYLDRHIIGVKMYHATNILFPLKGLHADNILTLNDITAHPTTSFGFHDGNE